MIMLRHVCGLDIVYVLKHRDTRDMMPTMRLYDHNITNVVDQISALYLFEYSGELVTQIQIDTVMGGAQ